MHVQHHCAPSPVVQRVIAVAVFQWRVDRNYRWPHCIHFETSGRTHEGTSIFLFCIVSRVHVPLTAVKTGGGRGSMLWRAHLLLFLLIFTSTCVFLQTTSNTAIRLAILVLTMVDLSQDTLGNMHSYQISWIEEINSGNYSVPTK